MDKEYIPYIRSLVGHRRVMAIGVSITLRDKEGRYLIEKRQDDGRYCFPGGALDFDEKLIDGARRELKEETGIEAGELTLLALLSGKEGDFHYPNGDFTSYVTVHFLGEIACMAPLSSFQESEVKELLLLPLDQLPPLEEFLPGDQKVIEFLRQGKEGILVD